MATFAQVGTAILKNILAQGSDADLESNDFAELIFITNNFMFDLDARGVNLGYTEVTTLADTITIPTGALRGLIYNVAIDAAPQYDGTISPGLVKAAADGLRTMEQLGVIVTTSSFPSTLPVGAGNEHNGFGTSRRFFPDREAEILAETSGAIGLEAGTEEST